MLKTFLRMFLVAAVGISTALVANALRWDKNADGTSNSLPLVTPPKEAPKQEDLISLEEARELWDMQGYAFFLDARPSNQYAEGHIAFAWSMPADAFQQHLPTVQPLLTPESPIVVYCDGTECELSHRVAEKLKNQGFQNVRILVNGWTLWKAAGFPTNQGEEP
jgi:rhodanese-related sulfurtransferase